MQRLRIAKEFGDKAAERRAQCNLGNAHIFLGQFEAAVENYKQTLTLAEELKDRVVEAQACYSLGNTYTLLRDYNSAIEYHLRHLKIAQELRDRIGEGRAYWSLGNAMTAVGDPHEALTYAQKHLEISKEIGDITGQTTAQMSISDLRKLLETDLSKSPVPVGTGQSDVSRHKRLSMDRMEIMSLTPQQRKHSLNTVDELSANSSANSGDGQGSHPPMTASCSTDFISKSHEDFLDLVSKFQSKRMDDQRCPLNGVENKENRKPICGQPTAIHQLKRQFSQPIRENSGNNNPNSGGNPTVSVNNTNNNRNNSSQAINNHIGNVGQSSQESRQSSQSSGEHFHDLIDLIAGMQGRRMDDQRASLPPIRRNSATNGPESLPQQRNHNFVQQNRNININNDNRNDLVPRMRQNNPQNPRRMAPSRQYSLGANVLPDDDFFEMLMRCQASRLEDQRAVVPGTSSERSSRPSTLERPQSVVSTQSNSPQQVFSLLIEILIFIQIV